MFVVVWVAYCACCVLLAIERTVNICSRQWTHRLFDGIKCWIWLALTAIYSLSIGSQPLIYNSQLNVWLFDHNLDDDITVIYFSCHYKYI
jgi:hypothetical protein